MTLDDLGNLMSELVGVTGWTYPDIRALTVPEFMHALSSKGRMLRPLVQALLDVKRLEGLDDQPGRDGEPSSVQKVLDGYENERKGIIKPLTGKERRAGRAAAIILRAYYGDPDAQQSITAEPFPGMGGEEARAIVQWVKDGAIPPDVWATQVLHVWERLLVSAGLD